MPVPETPATAAQDLRRIKSEFDNDCICRHGMLAYNCGQRDRDGHKTCSRNGPLDAVTRDGKTIKEVIRQYVDAHRIAAIELIEYAEGKWRRRKLSRIAKTAGIVGLSLAVVGGAVKLLLIRRRDTPAGDAK